jgi:hypothetical protein
VAVEGTTEAVDGHTERELRRQPESQIEGLQWEVNPAATQTDPTVSRPIQQIRAEQAANVLEDLWVAAWVEAVTAIIDGDTSDFETARVPPDLTVPFQQGDARLALACQTKRRTDAGRSRS